MNTAAFIPYDAVAPIIIFDKNQKIPFYSGTGFFVKFLPFDDIFFITAKHCVVSDENIDFGQVYVHAILRDYCKDSVLFDRYLIGGKKIHILKTLLYSLLIKKIIIIKLS